MLKKTIIILIFILSFINSNPETYDNNSIGHFMVGSYCNYMFNEHIPIDKYIADLIVKEDDNKTINNIIKYTIRISLIWYIADIKERDDYSRGGRYSYQDIRVTFYGMGVDELLKIFNKKEN